MEGDGIRIHLHNRPRQSTLQPYSPPGEEMFEQIKSKLEPSRYPLAVEPRHENQSAVTRSSREPTHYANHLHVLYPLPILPQPNEEEK